MTEKPYEKEPSTPETQRLDKWLQIAHIYKTRSQATHACDERRVKINGSVAKPAKSVNVGDVLTVKRRGGNYINLTITGIVRRSIPAREARFLYEMEVQEISEESRELLEFYKQAEKEMRPKYKGRPTKKERRKLESMKKRNLPWT
ncbi:MAG: RNA-binding protein [Calditrichaeota bacterium]|nr:RNA-binding protein [Calditrichota bacterium]